MTERPPDPDLAGDPGASSVGGTPATPRWVKVSAIITLVVLVLLVILLLAGKGGGHGPGRHSPGGDRSDGHTGPPPGVTHQQP